MTTITTARHKTKFYLPVILGSLFFIGAATALLLNYAKEREWGNTQPKIFLMPLFSVAVFSVAIYSVYTYRKNAPNIQLNHHFISFDNQIYSLDEVEAVELTGKRGFPYIISFPMEAATLRFKNGDTKYIFDDMYENAWQVKSFLKQVVIDRKSYIEIAPVRVEKSELEGEWFDTFKGSQFTSMRGIMLWGLIGTFAFMLLTEENYLNGGIWFFIFLFIFWFLIFSWHMHYFKVSDKYLVVKNHNLFWKTKAYSLSNIDEVVFETQGKMPNCLRVITKNYKTKLYPAGTLRDKMWIELKNKLERHNIIVRNECIVEND